MADQRVQANVQVNRPFTNVNKPLPDQDVSDLLLEHLLLDDHGCLPFQFQTLYEYQQEDEHLLALPNEQPQKYQYKTINGFPLFCRIHGQNRPIALTDALLPKVVKWFHNATAHNADITHLENHLHLHFHHSKLSAEVR